MKMNRRRVLQAFGVITTGGLAGCSDFLPVNRSDAPTSTSRTTNIPDSTPPNWNEVSHIDTLSPLNGASYDEFGFAVDTAQIDLITIVGAPGDDGSDGSNAGAAHIFSDVNGDWTHQQMLVPDSRHPVARFGASVALSADGTTALVGAPLESSSETDLAGVAYLFVKNDNEWVQQTRFAPTSIDSGDEFGRAVALSKEGRTAVVGSPGDETSDGVAVGTVYVFTQGDDDWNVHARIIPPAGDTGDRFGTDVDLARDGSIALVGSFAKDAAYICERNEASWVVQQRFSSQEGDTRGTFGNSVSLSRNGSTAVVGAPQAGSAGKPRTGASYIYVSTPQGWTHQEELKPDKLDGEDFFGASVSINEAGNGVVVGAPLDDEFAGSDSGSTHTFIQNNGSWDYISQIGGKQANQRDQFGYATAIGANDTIFVGTVRGNNTNGEKTGTVGIVAPSED